MPRNWGPTSACRNTGSWPRWPGARHACARAAPPQVVLVPGIMGSQLGLRRPAPLPPDVLWMDPLDIERGRLSELRLPDSARRRPLGVVLFSYLRLKLRLRAHGIAVECHDYDWRRPVVELGRELAARLRTADAARLAMVATAWAGCSRASPWPCPAIPHVERVVLLGTPNRGSFAAVQALRGTYAVVRKVARLVGRASAEYADGAGVQLLPESLRPAAPGATACASTFCDPQHWPHGGPQPARRAARRRALPRARSWRPRMSASP